MAKSASPGVASWAETAPLLVDVAAGRKPAELVVRNGRWVNVYSGEVIPGVDVAIAAGRFAFIGHSAEHAIGPETQVIDAGGRYLVPGLCDGHMHVESGMVTATEFARAVIPHGTTSMFVDPHEIANVLGLDGVRLMHDEAMGLPINMFVQMPSCVPSAPGLENAGASLGVPEVEEAMGWPNIIGLGEMMNFPGVINGDPKMLGEIAATQRVGKTVGGHYASPDLGLPFHAYVAGGPADDHEGTRLEDAVSRVRQGMRAMLRLGSAWYDVAAQIKAVTEQGIDSRNFILCTDDSHSGTLVHEGHMNRVVRHAIAQGLKPVTAIQMATLNTAQHFGLERELGSIAPGRRADMILTSDLAALPIETVIARGKVVAENGKLADRHPCLSLPRERGEDRASRPACDIRGLRHRRARGREPGDGAGDRRHREPGPDEGADAHPALLRRARRHGPRAATSARSRSSSAIAARATSPTASFRASATMSIARSRARWRMTATT